MSLISRFRRHLRGWPIQKPVGYPTYPDHAPPAEWANRITLPVTVEFGSEWESAIGEITLDASRLPRDGKYRFEIGYIVKEAHNEDSVQVIDEIDLVEVSLVADRPLPPIKRPNANVGDEISKPS